MRLQHGLQLRLLAAYKMPVALAGLPDPIRTKDRMQLTHDIPGMVTIPFWDMVSHAFRGWNKGVLCNCGHAKGGVCGRGWHEVDDAGD